jgi:hypothetical protein
VCSCDLHLRITVNQKWVFEFIVKFTTFSFKLGFFFFSVSAAERCLFWSGFFFAAIVALQFHLNSYFQMRNGKDKVLVNLNAERKHCLISDCRSEDKN